jgi:hypothetical protein
MHVPAVWKTSLRHRSGGAGALTASTAITRHCSRALAAPPARQQDEADGAALLPEEDQQIPGGYRDAMSSNTPLGKAVKGACRELNTLGDLVGGWVALPLLLCAPAYCRDDAAIFQGCGLGGKPQQQLHQNGC